MTASLLLFAFALAQCALSVTAAVTRTPPPNSNATFFCISPSNTTYKETLTDGKDIAKKLDTKIRFAFYVHGWRNKFEYDDKDSVTYKIGLAWVKSQKTNFCGVDWRKLASTLWYPRAAKKHIQTVGKQLAAFIKELHDLGVALAAISIAGHSLGAQVAGFAGETIYELYNQPIDTIYALDPAGPSFTSCFSCLGQSEFVLSKVDASYVQVLHTASGSYGTKQHLGHADYFVNNGSGQMACIYDLLLLRSWCKTKETDESAAVHDVYGINTDKKKGVFYMKATASEPYCTSND